jgi:hypothetical protein
MMKRFWLLVLVLVSVSTVGSQEVKHAPTVEQCRADQRLWLSKLESSVADPVANVSFKELSGWQHEMFECQSVDPEFHNRYYNTHSEIYAEKMRKR